MNAAFILHELEPCIEEIRVTNECAPPAPEPQRHVMIHRAVLRNKCDFHCFVITRICCLGKKKKFFAQFFFFWLPRLLNVFDSIGRTQGSRKRRIVAARAIYEMSTLPFFGATVALWKLILISSALILVISRAGASYMWWYSC